MKRHCTRQAFIGFLRLIVLVALMQTSAYARTPSWTAVSDSYFLDLSTVIRIAGGRKAWVMATSTEGVPLHGGIDAPYLSTMQLIVVRCDARTLAVSEIHFYDAIGGTGNLLATRLYTPVTMDFRDAAPGTIGDTLIEAICSKRLR